MDLAHVMWSQIDFYKFNVETIFYKLCSYSKNLSVKNVLKSKNRNW